MKRAFVFLLWISILFCSQACAEWFRGNTHTHTNLSDGDSPTETVVSWYKGHGYNFVVITDHNLNADLSKLDAALTQGGKFIVIPGNEITCQSEKKPVHLTAMGVSKPIQPYNGDTLINTIRQNIEQIQTAGALPIVNHPSHAWAFGAKELEEAGNVKLFEVYNSHPIVNNYGFGGMQSTEEIWDTLLSKGKHIWGVASDDTHTMKDFTPRNANPGRGWVMVRCDRLTQEDIASAMERGDFYFSTGAELSDISYDGRTYTVTIKPQEKLPKQYQPNFKVEFIGKGGKILAVNSNIISEYSLKGNEGYVRARITDSNGLKAWTQPVFINK